MFVITENLLRGSVATDQDSRLSWSEHNRSAVKFAGEDDDLDLTDEEEVSFSEPSSEHEVSVHYCHQRAAHIAPWWWCRCRRRYSRMRVKFRVLSTLQKWNKMMYFDAERKQHRCEEIKEKKT